MTVIIKNHKSKLKFHNEIKANVDTDLFYKN